MKKHFFSKQFLLLPFFFLFLSSPLCAADGDFAWVNTFGQNLDDIGYSISVDAAGYVYATGYFRGSVDFDPGTGSQILTSDSGSKDVFIVKMSSSGSLVWARRFGSYSDDEGLSIAVDGAGNVYTTGYFLNTVDFDPSVSGTHELTDRGGGDIFISKLDSSGNYVGAWSLGGTSFDYGYGILVDAAGNIYTTGYFQLILYRNDGSGFVDTGLQSAGDYDIFIAKIDTNGSFAWIDRIGNTATDVGLGIAAYSSGHLYLTGYFQGTVDFDPGPDPANVYNMTSNNSTEDVFVTKLDTDGNFVWARRLGGNSQDWGQAVSVDGSGNIYATGWFNTSAYFEAEATPVLTSNGSSDVFIAKLDSSGSLTWAKQIGGGNADAAYAIAVDASGNIYTTGSFQGTDVDFDPNGGTYPLSSTPGLLPPNNPSIDIFISKLDNGGNFIWAKGIGGTLDDYGYGIGVDGSANVYTTGYFQGTDVDFDPAPGTSYLRSSTGFEDIFISKLTGGRKTFPWTMFLPAMIGGKRQP